jgi:uncharacterized protein (TIGR00297 family)
LFSAIVDLILIAIISMLSYFAYRRRYLTLSGIIIAIVFGIILLIIAGREYLIPLLIAFFITNTATRYKIRLKIKLGLIKPNSYIRDYKNVLANGLPIFIFGLLEGIYKYEIFIYGYLVALTIFLSDTISSEIGVLSKKNPRLITNFKISPTGRPGAISLLGTISGILSVILFSVIIYFMIPLNISLLSLILILTFFSTLGNLLDSFLGATIQEIYYCEKCNQYSEEKIHICDNECKYVSGIKYVNNHVVNFVSILSVTILSIIFLSLILQ